MAHAFSPRKMRACRATLPVAPIHAPSPMPLPLLALAVAAFGIGTTEFVIMGLLPDVARDLSVSIPAAGMLVSAYALGVTIGAPIVASKEVGYKQPVS